MSKSSLSVEQAPCHPILELPWRRGPHSIAISESVKWPRLRTLYLSCGCCCGYGGCCGAATAADRKIDSATGWARTATGWVRTATGWGRTATGWARSSRIGRSNSSYSLNYMSSCAIDLALDCGVVQTSPYCYLHHWAPQMLLRLSAGRVWPSNERLARSVPLSVALTQNHRELHAMRSNGKLSNPSSIANFSATCPRWSRAPRVVFRLVAGGKLARSVLQRHQAWIACD